MLILLTIVLIIGAGGFAAWLFSLPETARSEAPGPIAMQEREATLNALRPAKRERPVIAIVGLNDATETTDYLMPYGVLKRAAW